MRLKVNTTDIEPKRVGDRIEFSFDSGTDLDYVILKGSDIFGDIHLSKIQLEQSAVSTSFVEPMETETVTSGLFKTVQGISYEITSPDSDTWAKITQSVEGSITTYHNGPLRSTIAHTIDDIIFGIRDIVSGDQASFNLRLDGIQQVVKDEMFESVQTQLSNFVGIELQDVEGRVNTIQNTVDGTIQQIGDVEGNLNTLQSTVGGTIQRISDVEGNVNTIQSTVAGNVQQISDVEGNLNTIQSTVGGTIQRISSLEGSFNTMQNTVAGSLQRIGDVEGNLNTIQSTASSNYQAISNLSGQYNTTKNTVNSMAQAIGTQGQKVAQIVMNDSIFKVDVIDEINSTKSSINVLSDSIGLRSAGNTIYIGGTGILIDAESIFLGSSTQIKDGIITNRLISSSANIDGAKIANATISNAKIASLDVSKISGNTANFVVANFNAGQYALTLSGTGLRSTGANYSYHLDSLGVEYYSGTAQVAVMRGYYSTSASYAGLSRGVAIIARSGHEIHLGYGTGGTTGTYTPAIAIDGTSGNIYMDNIYPRRNTSHGLRFAPGTVGGNQGWHLRHTNDNKAGIFFANNGDVYVRRATETMLNLSTFKF